MFDGENSMKIRNAIVRGVTTPDALFPSKGFGATVTFELRTDCVYYTWRAQDAEENHLGSASRPVSLRIVPKGEDPFEVAFAHAIANIKGRRSRRKREFVVESAEWKD